MAKEKESNYFSMMENMAECACRAADGLEHILKDFKIERLGENLKQLHSIEHEADELKHRLVEKLAKEFITPIEREDIMDITNQIDDVTDAVEDVLIHIYMFNVQTIAEDAIAFSDIIHRCCRELLHIFEEFGNYKRPKKLHESIVELNRLEEQGDALYISAVRKLHISQAGPTEVSAWTEIYSRMETVCDTCEHVADLVEHVVMKNS